uniref:BEACH domain-containing protein n=1 Tax=Macrostomum lignano TaxID=282301 RepID=A0A1I8IUV6_9PLAT
VRLASNVDVKRRWLNLATQLTHEQAVWHRPSSDVPPSWQIDPTEGPSRVRVRLKRCHTGLAAKFFKQSAKWKATWDPAAGPLAFLFREDRLTEDASATLFQLHRNDKIRLNRRCLSVAASAETPGEFLIGERCMYFVGDDTVWDASQAQLPPDAAAELQLPKLAAAAWYDCQSLKLMPPVVAPPDLPAPASCRCFCACARRLLTTESSRRWLPTSIRRCSGASSSASSSRLGSASWLLPSSSATLISLLANFTAQLEAAASCPPSAWSMSVSRMPLFCLSGWQSLILLMPSALVLLAIELRPALPLPLSLALETRLTNSSVKQALYTLTDAVVGDAVSHGDRPAEDSAGQFHNHCPPGASRQSKRGAHGEAQQQGEADESHGLSPAGLNAGHEADDGEAVQRGQRDHVHILGQLAKSPMKEEDNKDVAKQADQGQSAQVGGRREHENFPQRVFPATKICRRSFPHTRFSRSEFLPQREFPAGNFPVEIFLPSFYRRDFPARIFPADFFRKKFLADSSGDAPQSASWSFDEVKEVHLRRYELRDNALEIFLASGAAYLLAFQSPRDRDEVARVVDGLELDSRVRQLTVDEAQRQWVTGQMSNFEYLAFLNTASGRSYNDLMQYPVFPWVLADYDSAELDLTQPATFRDLARPIAPRTTRPWPGTGTNTKVLDRQYRELGPDHATPPYHYSSHYSNSGTVLHYLVRLPPYTQLFTVYQDRHFDLPDRTFHSIRTSWRLSSKLSDSDVKELIPDFFINSEELDFGVKQSGVRVDNVELPPWAADDPRRFVLIHRAALESPLVTEKLHKQGCAQLGETCSTRTPTSAAIDLDQIDDPVRRRAIETMIKTYGQTPKQLFRSPHQPPVGSGASLWPGARGFRRSIWKLLRLTRLPGPPQMLNPRSPEDAGPQVGLVRAAGGPGGPAGVDPSACRSERAPEVLGLCPGTLRPGRRPACWSAPLTMFSAGARRQPRQAPAPALDKRWARLRRTGWATGSPRPLPADGARLLRPPLGGLLRVFSVAASSTGSAAPASSSASGAAARAGGPDRLARRGGPCRCSATAVTAAHACPEFALLAHWRAAAACCCGTLTRWPMCAACDLLVAPVVALTASRLWQMWPCSD